MIVMMMRVSVLMLMLMMVVVMRMVETMFMIVIVMMMFMAIPVLVIMVVMIMRMLVMMVVIMTVMVMMIIMRVLMMVVMGQMLMRELPFADIRVHLPDNDAQHVRLLRQVACACAIADAVYDHRREAFGKLVDDACDNAGACRRCHFHRVRCGSDRHANHHFERSRRRHRVNAVIDMDRAGTERYWRSINALDIQRVDGQCYADNIDDGIDGSDFVEMHFLDGGAVNFGFRDGDFFENGQAERGCAIRKFRFADDFHDFGIVTVMLRRMLWIEHDVELRRRDAALDHALPIKRVGFEFDFGQLFFNVTAVCSRID